MQNGKGDAPRNCFSQQYRENYDLIFGNKDNNEVYCEIIRGNKYWRLRKNDKLHRDGDKPAIEWASGSKEWYQNDQRHRDGDKPAIERANGDKFWYKKGELFRANKKPTIEYGEKIIKI